MGNSQSHGPRGLHAPVYAHNAYGGLPGVRPGISGRWPRMEPPAPVQVLPQLPPPNALRNTLNGAILQQGGTISARPNSGVVDGRRPRSSSAHRLPQPEQPDLTRCGSEPDLRAQNHQQRRDTRHHQMTRGRKKYRAPPVPHPGSGMESSSPDMNGWDAVPRKARLFKTRVETNKKQQEDDLHRRIGQTLSLPRADLRDGWSERDEKRPWQSKSDLREDPRVRHRRSESIEETRKTGSPMERPFKRDEGGENGVWPSHREEVLSLPRVDLRDGRRSAIEEHSLQRSRSQDALTAKGLSTPEFQAELAEVAKRLRPRSALIARHANSASPELPGQQFVRSQNEIAESAKENAQPAKTFYFGMEESNKTVVKTVNTNVNMTNREHRLTAVERSKNIMNKRQKIRDDGDSALDKFAANFQKNRQQHSVSGTSSLGSDPDPDEIDGGIALQLRPTLPRKQLEIPRFSPTAAWRLLSSLDVSPAASPDSGRDMLEDRIPAPDCAQLSLDKSADSGISGDASPGGGHESSSELIESPPKTIHYHNQHQKALLLAWTPEQDLEESSSEEEPALNSKMVDAPGAKLTTRGQLFSTLPRERIDDALQDSGSLFNSLRRPANPSDSNWLLSRSVPGSLNNGHASLLRTTSGPSSPEHLLDEQTLIAKFPSYSYLAQGGHVVYLPEYRSKASEIGSNGFGPHFHDDIDPIPLSRSCENVCADMQEREENISKKMETRCMTEHRPQKKKKFTFQSTVRVIEKRRIAEKLSKEAEFKESQRLSELDAMRRVEEEFQRKRAREKANIRHQLRLFSLEEKEYASLPPLDWGRPEPDGAPASLPPAPRAQTQVLSEYREATRDYRDYPNNRHSPDLPVEVVPRKNIVKHPRVVADIPKNLPVYVSAQTNSNAVPSPRPRDNYRKDFAHGSLGSARPAGSDSGSQPYRQPVTRTSQPLPTIRPEKTTWSNDSRSRSASPRSESPRSRSSSPEMEDLKSPSLVQPWAVYKSRSVSISPEPENHRRSRSKSSNHSDRGRRSRSASSCADPKSIKQPETTDSDSKEPKDMPVAATRMLLAGVQPFNKTGKSYRPINFSPKKVAQIVN